MRQTWQAWAMSKSFCDSFVMSSYFLKKHSTCLREPIISWHVSRARHQVEFENRHLNVKLVEATRSSQALPLHDFYWRAMCCTCLEEKCYVKCSESGDFLSARWQWTRHPTLSNLEFHNKSICWKNASFTPLLDEQRRFRLVKTRSPSKNPNRRNSFSLDCRVQECTVALLSSSRNERAKNFALLLFLSPIISSRLIRCRWTHRLLLILQADTAMMFSTCEKSGDRCCSGETMVQMMSRRDVPHVCHFWRRE